MLKEKLSYFARVEMTFGWCPVVFPIAGLQEKPLRIRSEVPPSEYDEACRSLFSFLLFRHLSFSLSLFTQPIIMSFYTSKQINKIKSWAYSAVFLCRKHFTSSYLPWNTLFHFCRQFKDSFPHQTSLFLWWFHHSGYLMVDEW